MVDSMLNPGSFGALLNFLQCYRTAFAMIIKHINFVHKNLRPYECTQCGKNFGRKIELKKHISMVHQKLKPYQCPLCNKSFGSKMHLQVHQNGVHEKLNPFQCQDCQGTFRKKQSLNNHMPRCRKSSSIKTLQK